MIVNKLEKGQTIIMIVVSVLLMVVMAALIVDGGNVYLNRRHAQTAADASVLAAAHARCVDHVAWTDLQPVVDEYATVHNDADSATYTWEDVSLDYPKGKVTVETVIDVPTVFAKVLGKPTVRVRADASSGCFLPAEANNLLPVAWTCTAHEGSVETCEIQKIPIEVFDALEDRNGQPWFETYLLDQGDKDLTPFDAKVNSYMDDLDGDGGQGKLVYMVMDDADFDENLNCKELNLRDDVGPPLGDLGDPPGVGLITCDFDGDGIVNVQGSERGWLELGQGGGAVDLWELMLYGYPGVIEMPQWFVASDGVRNSVFINAHQIKFRKSLVPVYNAICPIPGSELNGTTEETLPEDCPDEYIDASESDPLGQADLILPSTGSQEYFRVPGIAVFVITCVSKGNSEYCPGKDLSGVKNNTSTIEGYFLSGYIAGKKISTGGFDLGVYVLSLTE